MLGSNLLTLQNRAYLPSIRHSFTISHNRFISDSGRYLHCFAISSHSSGPAPFDIRAGPGCGTGSPLDILTNLLKPHASSIGMKIVDRG
jgi:hypothetical protein